MTSMIYIYDYTIFTFLEHYVMIYQNIKFCLERKKNMHISVVGQCYSHFISHITYVAQDLFGFGAELF